MSLKDIRRDLVVIRVLFDLFPAVLMVERKHPAEAGEVYLGQNLFCSTAEMSVPQEVMDSVEWEERMKERNLQKKPFAVFLTQLISHVDVLEVGVFSSQFSDSQPSSWQFHRCLSQPSHMMFGEIQYGSRV